MGLRVAKRTMKLASLLAACLVLGAAGAASAQEGGWVNVSDSLTAAAEGYDDTIPGARGVSGVAVDRFSGDVMMCLNGPPFGIWRSADAGKTWSRMDSNAVAGGWIRSFSIRVDQDKPGRVAVFRAWPPNPESGAKSALTLDGGKSWHPISKPPFEHFGYGGWTHAMVAWADEPNDIKMIGQNRIRPAIYISDNGGKKWDAIQGKFKGIIEDTYTIEYMRAKDPGKWESWKKSRILGYGLCGDAHLLGRFDSIQRSTDKGENWETVSDFVVAAHTPVKFDGKLYWGAEKGVIVSDDAGKSWKLLGSELPMVRKGPFFGKDASTMVVVTEDGVYKTTDAGSKWIKVSDLFQVPDAWRAEHPPLWLRHDYAWDPTRDVLYVTGLAGSAYKKELK